MLILCIQVFTLVRPQSYKVSLGGEDVRAVTGKCKSYQKVEYIGILQLEQVYGDIVLGPTLAFIVTCFIMA